MAAPSRPPTFKAFGLRPYCSGCGRRLTPTEPLWFQGHPFRAVWGWCCALTNRVETAAERPEVKA